MLMFKLFLHAMLVFSIYQCLLSTSEANRQTSLKQAKKVMHSRNNKNYESIDQQYKEDENQADIPYSSLKSEHTDMNTTTSSIYKENYTPTKESKDNTRYRRRRFSDQGNKHHGINLFQNKSKLNTQDQAPEISIAKVNNTFQNKISDLVIPRPFIDSNKKWTASSRHSSSKYIIARRRLFNTPKSYVRSDSYYYQTTSEPEAVRTASTRVDKYITNHTISEPAAVRTASTKVDLTNETTSEPEAVKTASTKVDLTNETTSEPEAVKTESTKVDLTNETSEPEAVKTESTRVDKYLTNETGRISTEYSTSSGTSTLSKKTTQTGLYYHSVERSTITVNPINITFLEDIATEYVGDINTTSDLNISEASSFPNETNHSEEINSKPTSKCPPCCKTSLTEEQAEFVRLSTFKELLADKLRIDLDTSPQTDGMQADGNHINQQIPKLPASILEQTIQDNAEEIKRDQFHAIDQEVIIPGDHMGRDCVKVYHTGCYSFSLRDQIKYEVAEAYLWFYKTKYINDFSGNRFNVSKLERLKSGSLAMSSLTTNDITYTKDGWIRWNVTPELLRWVDMRKDEQLLAIRCSNCDSRSYKKLFGIKQDYKPMLVVKYVKKSPISRKKRSDLCDPRYECCKRNLTVNFHEISLTEIYEPSNLSIGYCYGECNNIHQYTYNHTVLRQRVRVSSIYAHHPTMNLQLKPCCVPLVLKDAFLMIVENNVYIRKVVPKVIVETCGCM